MTLSSIGEAFMLHGCRNPVREEDESMTPAINQMLRGYGQVDPPMKQEAALPPLVLKEACRETESPRAWHHANLFIGAFFFECRSCEYLVVTQRDII